MPKCFIQEFLDVLALGFGTVCTNCLQVEAIVTIKPVFSDLWYVYGRVGEVVQSHLPSMWFQSG